MYCVGVFPTDKKVCVLLQKWCFREGSKSMCYWPGASLLGKALKSNQNIDKKNWICEEVLVKSSFSK
jgi:hypothetical protein